MQLRDGALKQIFRLRWIVGMNLSNEVGDFGHGFVVTIGDGVGGEGGQITRPGDFAEMLGCALVGRDRCVIQGGQWSA